VKNNLILWLKFLTVKSVKVLTLMLVTDTLLSSQLAKILHTSLIFLLTLVMVVLFLLMVSSLLVLLKIYGKVEDQKLLTLTPHFLMVCTWWLLLVQKDVVMVQLLGDSKLTVVIGKNSLLKTSINRCVHLKFWL
jgi:hypothetical protein